MGGIDFYVLDRANTSRWKFFQGRGGSRKYSNVVFDFKAFMGSRDALGHTIMCIRNRC